MTAAKVATVAKTPGLPEPVAHTAKLRDQGLSDAQVGKALKDMGYPAATVATSKTPRPAPTTAAPAAAPTPAAPASGRLERSDSGTTRYLSSPAAALPGGVAGFLMGLGATAVLINFMRGGTPQVRRWTAAKFMNITTGAPTGASNVPGTAANVSTGAAVLPGTTQWGQW